MGNLEVHGGPLSQQQIKKMAQRGRRIVSRMEQLGMTPVLQVYVGFVPSDFQENVRIDGLKLIPQAIRLIKRETSSSGTVIFCGEIR